MFWRAAVVLSLALPHWGCAEQPHLLAHGATASPCSFWPPPPSSGAWIVTAPSLQDESLRAVAEGLEVGLRAGGYSEQRWYPIGVGNSHGFAVTTRLEQVDDATSRGPNGRWSSLYPEAANLKWLRQARSPQLPRPGRYRVLLISYTDLPIGRTSRAPTWDEETVMDWPNADQSFSPRENGLPERSPAGYRVGIYEYEYLWDNAEARGRLVPANPEQGATAPAPLLRSMGLASTGHERHDAP